MVMAALSSFRVLVVPGLYNSSPQHWQSRWQRLYPSFERVEQARWDAPVLEVWSERLRQQLQKSAQPTLAIAHSFGCLTTVHGALNQVPNLAGALLVAPADPDKFDVSAAVSGRLPVPAIVVGSLNDPWMESRRAGTYQRRIQPGRLAVRPVAAAAPGDAVGGACPGKRCARYGAFHG